MMVLTLIWPIGANPWPFTGHHCGLSAGFWLSTLFMLLMIPIGIAIHFVVERPATSALRWLLDGIAGWARGLALGRQIVPGGAGTDEPVARLHIARQETGRPH